jgi:hypothetical protein
MNTIKNEIAESIGKHVVTGNIQHAEGAPYSLKDTKAMIGYRQSQQTRQAIDSHKLAYSALVHSRPRFMNGTEDSSLLAKFWDSCITPDEKGNFKVWVETYSTWKAVTTRDDDGLITGIKFKFDKTRKWDFEGAILNPFMMRDTRKATIAQLMGLDDVVGKLEESVSRQNKLMSNKDKYKGGQYTDELKAAMSEFLKKIEEIKDKELLSVVESNETIIAHGEGEPIQA